MWSRWFVFSLLLLTAVAGGLAVLRFTQVETTLRLDEITTSEINNLEYDAASGVFTVVGPDPYIYIDLPRHSIPLQELRMDFKGPAQPGGWYIYPCPAHLRTPIINQDWVVTAVARSRDEGHSLIWTLEDSQLARIDFPDELDVLLTLERMVLTTEYSSSYSSVFVATVTLTLVALLTLFAGLVGPRIDHPIAQAAVIIVLVLFKVHLVNSMGQTIMMNLAHDDRLFITQGQSIAQGEWLGGFNELTLSKGPVFPMFLALSSKTGWSLQTDVALLHAIAALLFVLALRPWITSPSWRLLLLALLLFDPHSLSAEVVGRILRSMTQPAFTLLTLAGFLGLLTRPSQPAWRLVPWSILAGAGGFTFVYAREEGVWLLPTVVLLTATAVIFRATRGRSSKIAFALILLGPGLVFGVGKTVLEHTNATHYGMAIGVDGSETAFADAHGAILRVENPDPLPGAAATAATRQLIYAQSPTFADLQDVMENQMAPKWNPAGWHNYPTVSRSETEIRNGWFSWAIREAASIRGHYKTASTADAFWRQVADEINAAVEEGRLPGGSPRSGFFPRWHAEYLMPTIVGWGRSFDLMVRATDFRAHSIPSHGEPQEIAAIADFYQVDATTAVATEDWQGNARTIIHRVFSWLGWPLTLSALFCTSWIAKRALRQNSARPRFLVLLSLWGGAAGLGLIVSLVEATSFPAVIGAYLAPAASLIAVVWVLAPCWTLELKNLGNEDGAS
ncbi:MAG: hypothetical protein SynsKO_20390 [Synoicihabitans sp.]